MGKGFLAFGLVHGRVGGSVDHGVGGMRFNRGDAGGGVDQIYICAGKGGDVEIRPRKRAQLCGDLTAMTEDEELHALPNRSPTP